MKKITQNIFDHRTHCLGFAPALEGALIRAQALASMLKTLADEELMDLVNVSAAVESIGYEILDALALVGNSIHSKATWPNIGRSESTVTGVLPSGSKVKTPFWLITKTITSR